MAAVAAASPAIETATRVTAAVMAAMVATVMSAVVGTVVGEHPRGRAIRILTAWPAVLRAGSDHRYQQNKGGDPAGDRQHGNHRMCHVYLPCLASRHKKSLPKRQATVELSG